LKFTTIISTDELAENLHKPDWVIFDCRSHLTDHDAGLKAYQDGHIPNAIFCNLETDLSSAITESSGRHPLPDFENLITKLANWGVDDHTQVVVYDDMGGAFAVRLWWQLRTFGHNKVAVLNGGIPQWIKEEKTISTEAPKTSPKTFKASIDQSAWISSDDILKNLTSKKFIVLDARTPERYRGESEPIDTVAGRVPGSLNRAFQLNLDKNGFFLSEEQLKKQFTDTVKKTPDQIPTEIVHLCGSGVTACHNMLAMEIAGLTGSKLYAGSWSEWIRDSKRPIETG